MQKELTNEQYQTFTNFLRILSTNDVNWCYKKRRMIYEDPQDRFNVILFYEKQNDLENYHIEFESVLHGNISLCGEDIIPEELKQEIKNIYRNNHLDVSERIDVLRNIAEETDISEENSMEEQYRLVTKYLRKIVDSDDWKIDNYSEWDITHYDEVREIETKLTFMESASYYAVTIIDCQSIRAFCYFNIFDEISEELKKLIKTTFEIVKEKNKPSEEEVSLLIDKTIKALDELGKEEIKKKGLWERIRGMVVKERN